MAKREMTLQSRLGFDDHELKTPQHDALMAWLTDNVERCPRIVKWLDGIFDKDALITNVAVKKREWERPITKAGTGFIGFIDLSVEFALNEVVLSRSSSRYDYCERICNLGNYELWKSALRKTANIEVKPSIRSVGETIRQINVYRATLGYGEFVFVASPDVRFSPIFEAQGIGFIELPKLNDVSERPLLGSREVVAQ